MRQFKGPRPKSVRVWLQSPDLLLLFDFLKSNGMKPAPRGLTDAILSELDGS